MRDIVGDGHKLHVLLEHIDKDGDGIVTTEEVGAASASLLKVSHADGKTKTTERKRAIGVELQRELEEG